MPGKHKRTPLSVRPPDEDQTWLEKYAAEHKRSVHGIITEAISRFRTAVTGDTDKENEQ
jgi:hypothetical protein